MSRKTSIKIDLGEHKSEAYERIDNQPDLLLEELVKTYPAKFYGDTFEKYRKRKVSDLIFEPVIIEKDGSQPAKSRGKVRKRLDDIHAEDEDSESIPPPHEDEIDQYPGIIKDRIAVLTAYHLELEAVARFLANNISVLVVCDKILTEFIYEYVCAQAGKKVVLEPTATNVKKGLATGFAEALEGKKGSGKNTPREEQQQPQKPEEKPNLHTIINNLKGDEVLILRSLDMLDNPEAIDIVYLGTSQEDKKPLLLAFLDSSLEVKKVLTNRFSVHVPLLGIPRHVSPDGTKAVYTVTQLLTRRERECFQTYDPEGLYKNVSGLNAIQFRNAMRYVAAEIASNSAPVKIYRTIRQFKISTSDEIEIPDTNFKDIGGYEHVKQQLNRIIALMAGPVQGISEKQRGALLPRGFIFHGPPGTGKTLFAKAIANELNATIQMISGPEIMDKYVGQSEDNLRRIFATARRNAPAVIFFDEFDSVASQRSNYSDGGARANNAVVAQLLTELDGFRQEQTVLVIGTTNRIDIIDEALLRPSRLRPIEIGLPDFAARQHVAAIHAHDFGIDTLLEKLFDLVDKHSKNWKKGKDIPKTFLNALYKTHKPYETRIKVEEQRASFLRELQAFFNFVNESRKKKQNVQAESRLVSQMSEHLVSLGEKYGLDLSQEELPDLKKSDAEALLLPMQTDLRELFTVLQEEKKKAGGLSQEVFLHSVMDLVAEYTENFNNDEIRAIFQEASLEHHMEGQLITPRYLGQKIGLVRKRRDEREAVHLSSERGTN